MPEMGERMATVEANIKEIRYDLYGNGKPGLVPRLEAYLAVQDDRDTQASKRDRSLKRWIAIGAIVATCSKPLVERLVASIFH